MRSDLSLTEERNFFAGNTLPRLTPLMSGTIHSTSSILWSLIHCSRLTDMRPRLGRGAGPLVEDQPIVKLRSAPEGGPFWHCQPSWQPPIIFVIASGGAAWQSRARVNRSGLLRSARNDG